MNIKEKSIISHNMLFCRQNTTCHLDFSSWVIGQSKQNCQHDTTIPISRKKLKLDIGKLFGQPESHGKFILFIIWKYWSYTTINRMK